MAAIYSAFLSGVVADNPLASGATTLTATALSGMPVVAAPNFMWLILDPNGVNGLPEIVQVTVHTAAAGTCTIVRGQQTSQGGAAAHAHIQNTVWVCAQTPNDFDQLDFRQVTTKGDFLIATAANTLARQPVGTNGLVLQADSAQTNGVRWANRPGYFGATGSAVTTSAGTDTLVATITIPDQGVGGLLLVQGTLYFNNYTNADIYYAYLHDTNTAGTVFGQCRCYNGRVNNLDQMVNITSAIVMAGGASKTIVMSLQRISGTGAANTFADFTLNRLDVTFIPN